MPHPPWHISPKGFMILTPPTFRFNASCSGNNKVSYDCEELDIQVSAKYGGKPQSTEVNTIGVPISRRPTQHIIHLLLNQNTAFLGTRLATQFFHPSKASDVVIWRLRNSAEQNSQTTRDVPITQQPNSQASRPTRLVIPLLGSGRFETNPNPGRVNSSSLLEEKGVVPRHHPLIGITSIQTLYHTHNWCLSFFSPKEQRISLAIQESWITSPNMGLRNPPNSQVIQESWIASQSRLSCTAKNHSAPGSRDPSQLSTVPPHQHSPVIQESWIADFFVLPLQTPPNRRVIQESWITPQSWLSCPSNTAE